MKNFVCLQGLNAYDEKSNLWMRWNDSYVIDYCFPNVQSLIELNYQYNPPYRIINNISEETVGRKTYEEVSSIATEEYAKGKNCFVYNEQADKYVYDNSFVLDNLEFRAGLILYGSRPDDEIYDQLKDDEDVLMDYEAGQEKVFRTFLEGVFRQSDAYRKDPFKNIHSYIKGPEENNQHIVIVEDAEIDLYFPKKLLFHQGMNIVNKNSFLWFGSTDDEWTNLGNYAFQVIQKEDGGVYVREITNTSDNSIGGQEKLLRKYYCCSYRKWQEIMNMINSKTGELVFRKVVEDADDDGAEEYKETLENNFMGQKYSTITGELSDPIDLFTNGMYFNKYDVNSGELIEQRYFFSQNSNLIGKLVPIPQATTIIRNTQLAYPEKADTNYNDFFAYPIVGVGDAKASFFPVTNKNGNGGITYHYLPFGTDDYGSESLTFSINNFYKRFYINGRDKTYVTWDPTNFPKITINTYGGVNNSDIISTVVENDGNRNFICYCTNDTIMSQVYTKTETDDDGSFTIEDVVIHNVQNKTPRNVAKNTYYSYTINIKDETGRPISNLDDLQIDIALF